MKKLWSRIKQFLRNNPTYQKYFKNWINDLRYASRDLRRYLRDYHFGGGRGVTGNTLYFIIDPKMSHPGLTDRMNVMSCIYYVAKCNGFDFKVVLDERLPMTDSIVPNKVDWVGSAADLSFSLSDSRLFSYNGGKHHVPKLNRKVHQYHVYNYIGLDIILNTLRNDAEWKKTWNECFNDLFRPSADLQKLIDGFSAEWPEASYTAAHIRFVNALDHFEDDYSNTLSEDKAKDLIGRVLDALERIEREEGRPVLVFSDSERFLNIALEHGFHTVEGGHIAHVSFDPSALQKAALDFFMIARACSVHKIRARELYNSTFPQYAAIAGGKPQTTDII